MLRKHAPVAVRTVLRAAYGAAGLLLLGLVVFLALHPLLGVALATGFYYRFADRIAEVRAALAEDPTPGDPGLAEDSKEGDGDAPPPTRLARLRETAFGTLAPLALRAKGLHADARARLDREAATVAGTRFELVVIDHGFHTDVPEHIRLIFCKLWKAIAFVDVPLLFETGRELGLGDDDTRVLTQSIALFPYEFWVQAKIPGPFETREAMHNQKKSNASVNAKLPKALHVLSRANLQIFGYFCQQYGFVPQTRLFWTAAMAKHALMGLAFSRDCKLPDVDDLETATKDFFDREEPKAAAYVAAHMKFDYPKFQVKRLSPDRFFKETQKIVAKGGDVKSWKMGDVK